MLRCSLSVLMTMLLLNGCAARLESASDSWDRSLRRPDRVTLKPESKAPVKTATAATPAVKIQRPAKDPTSRTPDARAWAVTPPQLPDAAPRLDPTRPGGLEVVPAGSVVALAERFLGTPYVYGGETPAEGFDCSGLVHYVFGLKGIAMRRLANEQFLQGQPVDRTQLQPGDLVFFSSSGKIVDHVGIYAGDRLFIHAPRTGRTVSYDSLDTAWYSSRYQGARRING